MRIVVYGAAFLVCCALLFYPAMDLLAAVFSYANGGLVAQYPGQLKSALTHEHLTYLPYRALPHCAVEGIVSVEDKRFFMHPGVDPIAALRVAFQSLQYDHQDHGGSTLTQQLSRMVLRAPRQQPSLFSELHSQLRILEYALVIEHDFSKKKILELYLNSAYYGRGARGLAQAAAAYFHNDVAHLTTGQYLYLAGLPQAPTYYGSNPQGAAAHGRYLHVLATLRRNGYISDIQEHVLRASTLFSLATLPHLTQSSLHRQGLHVSTKERSTGPA